MTTYELGGFTAADAEALTGQRVTLTEWGDEDLTTKVTYAGAWVTGHHAGHGYIVLGGGTVTVTDAEDGNPLFIAGLDAIDPGDDTPHNVFFHAVCEVTPDQRPEPAAVDGGRREYPSLTEFYQSTARAGSGERDYGRMWQDGETRWPLWSVSYIRATGEIYAAEQRDPGRVRVLGVVPPDDGPGVWYATLSAILGGWADPDISGHDLAWVERRLAQWAEAKGSAPYTVLRFRDTDRGRVYQVLDARTGLHAGIVTDTPAGPRSYTILGEPALPEVTRRWDEAVAAFQARRGQS